MVGIIIFTAFMLLTAFYFCKELMLDNLGEILKLLITWFLLGGFVFGFITVYFICPFTGGFYKNYSIGERTGYITKTSDEGLYYKTFECEMQIGTGQQAALQLPFEFSISKEHPEVIIDAIRFAGGNKKVKIKYTRWLIMPFEIGGSSYEVTSIEEVGD